MLATSIISPDGSTRAAALGDGSVVFGHLTLEQVVENEGNEQQQMSPIGSMHTQVSFSSLV